jgi:hypothetical protein
VVPWQLRTVTAESAPATDRLVIEAGLRRLPVRQRHLPADKVGRRHLLALDRGHGWTVAAWPATVVAELRVERTAITDRIGFG